MTTTANVLAVGLAALGALFFGLAALRQHGAVRAGVAPRRSTLRQQAVAVGRVVRQPAWLLGAAQAALGGGLHVVALALAPVTLVQPVGVLAVPVTVVASAVARRRRPPPGQLVGALLGVVGVAGLTAVLLRSAAQPGVLPAWPALAAALGVVAGCSAAVLLVLRRATGVLRCLGRAVVAAVLFGTGSVLVHTLGEVVSRPPAHPVGLVVTALLGLAVALPVGVWTMQSAYVVGSPQVVVCCLTLVDPLTAVLGGRLLLHEDAALTAGTLVAAVGSALVAAAGVVLLAREDAVRTDP